MKPVQRIMTRSKQNDKGCLICDYHPSAIYAQVRWFNETTGKWSMRQASVLVYEHHYGPIPGGMVVMHKCDNPRCVNIEHLRLGTQKENVQDSIDKRRWSMNDRHKWSKLSVQDVREIRESPLCSKDLAAQYSVSYRHIRYIVTGAERKYAP
jgi:hypothetical protein